MRLSPHEKCEVWIQRSGVCLFVEVAAQLEWCPLDTLTAEPGGKWHCRIKATRARQSSYWAKEEKELGITEKSREGGGGGGGGGGE